MFISTTAVAKKMDLSSVDLFKMLDEQGLIHRQVGKEGKEKWVITSKGEEYGGKMISHPKYDDSLAWPENIDFSSLDNVSDETLLSATDIAKYFNTSASNVNKVFNSLGYIQKEVEGWRLTTLGKKHGGFEVEYKKYGTINVKWSNQIKVVPEIIDWFSKGIEVDQESEKNHLSKPKSSLKESLDKKYPPKIYTQDGHKVRSQGEKSIDDFLYMNNISHAYERVMYTELGELVPDFFIPPGAKDGSVSAYIEFWGMTGKDYENRKQKKLKIYKQEGLLPKLIQIEKEHVTDMSTELSRQLLIIAKIRV